MAPLLHTTIPLRQRPWANYLLLAVTTAVYLLQVTPVGDDWLTRYMLDARTLRLRHFMTYAFVHIGPAHLLFNMIVLFALGHNVNDLLGHVGYLAFYLAGAVLAALGFIVAGGDAVVGASGAVGAVMAAYLVFFPRSSILLTLRDFILEIPAMYFITVFFIYNVVMSFVARSGQQHLAYEAHVAGMAFGFLTSWLLLITRLAPRLPNDLLEILRRRHLLRRASQTDPPPDARDHA